MVICEKWKWNSIISLSGLNGANSTLMPLIYIGFQFSYNIYFAWVGFGLFEGNIDNDYKYIGHSAWISHWSSLRLGTVA